MGPNLDKKNSYILLKDTFFLKHTTYWRSKQKSKIADNTWPQVLVTEMC